MLPSPHTGLMAERVFLVELCFVKGTVLSRTCPSHVDQFHATRPPTTVQQMHHHPKG